MTARAPKRVGACVAAAATLLGSACGNPEPVRIGIIISGEGVSGAQFAVSEINNSRGIHGRPLSLRVMSEGGSTLARPAIAAADSLSLDATVIGVVGHSNSSASLSGAQIYNARRVVQIAPTSSAPLLSEAGPYTFRLVASDVHQAQFLATQVSAGGARPRTAVFYVNDDYGRSLYQEFRARLGERGVPLVLESPYSEELPLADVDAVVRTMAAAHAEQLVWLGRSGQLRQLLPALRRLLPRIGVLASDGVDNAITRQNADGVLTGVRFACFVDMEGTRPALASLRERFRAKTGGEATVEVALTFDGVMLLAAAAREAGPGREAVRNYLVSLGTTRPAFRGATGDIAFDANGDPRPSYCLAEVTATGTRIVVSNAGQ